MLVGDQSPGKRQSYGDAIIWETLLATHPDGVDVHAISGDSDFASPLSPNELNSFLAREWNERKGSEAILHRNLTSFFQEQYPDIALASELEREVVAGQLLLSGSFQQTHDIIARMPPLNEFSDRQIIRVAQGAATNPQVHRISVDDDVFALMTDLVNNYADDLPEDVVMLLRYHINASRD